MTTKNTRLRIVEIAAQIMSTRQDIAISEFKNVVNVLYEAASNGAVAPEYHAQKHKGKNGLTQAQSDVLGIIIRFAQENIDPRARDITEAAAAADISAGSIDYMLRQLTDKGFIERVRLDDRTIVYKAMLHADRSEFIPEVK